MPIGLGLKVCVSRRLHLEQVGNQGAHVMLDIHITLLCSCFDDIIRHEQ